MYKGKKQKQQTEERARENPSDIASTLSKSMEENINTFKKLFTSDDTFMVRRFENEQNTEIKCCILYIEGMVDNAIINQDIIKPVVSSTSISSKAENNLENIMRHILLTNNILKESDTWKLTDALTRGKTLFFLDGSEEALVISAIGWQTRAITEPEGERIIRGPREGFTESMIMNLTMIRRKLANNNLKFKFRTLGRQSKTEICLCYIEGIANDQILKELNSRLDEIDIDGILASGIIAELIKDSPFSPFKTIGGTERPDVAVGKLLEGRIAVIVEGTPVVLTLPFIFIEYFQASEDYYINFYFSSINRLLRILSFILTISLPAVYVALTSFHMEMLPTALIKSISAARQSVPLPTAVELIALLIVFEILREAGTRMPTNIGQTLSIVGALVLGQASVEARLVSAPVVIILALTAITGLVLPRLKGAEIIARFLLLALSSFIGLYGYIFGMTGLIVYLFSMRSFGVPYMLTIMSFNPQDIKDTVIRAPWIYMKYRPKFIAFNNRVRNNTGGRKNETS